MHTQELALKTLDHLRSNNHILGSHVDLYRMPHDRLEGLVKARVAADPFLLSAWLEAQGYYMSIWALWEYYSRILSESMPGRSTPRKKEPHVLSVREILQANG